jgi:hypothetical protein
VNTASRLWAGRSGVRIPAGEKDCSLLQTVHTGYLVRPASCSLGTEVCFPAVKQPGREVDHLLPSSAKIKNEWICTAAPSVCLHDVDRDKCIFPRLIAYLIIVYKYVDGIFELLACHDLRLLFICAVCAGNWVERMTFSDFTGFRSRWSWLFETRLYPLTE